MVGKLDILPSRAQHRLAVAEDVPSDTYAGLKCFFGVDQRGLTREFCVWHEERKPGPTCTRLRAELGSKVPRWLTVECGDPMYSQRRPGVKLTLG